MKQKTNDEALNDYIAKIAQISKLAELLAEYADDHGGISPEAVNWADVGTVTEIVNQLNHVVEFAGIEMK